MITVKLRQQIIQTTFKAIKSLYGAQEKLSLEGYRNVEYGSKGIRAGQFYLRSEKGNYYQMRIENYNIVELQKGRVAVTFDR